MRIPAGLRRARRCHFISTCRVSARQFSTSRSLCEQEYLRPSPRWRRAWRTLPRVRSTEIGMTGKIDDRAFWSQSIYENEFVKQGGVWKFTSMHVYPRFIVDAEKGWAKDAQLAPGPSREFPPDRPPTEEYEIYPRFHIAPLHFNHPVTGRAPQYPEGTTIPVVVSAFRRTVPAPVKTTAA